MEELWLIWKEPLTRRRYKVGELLKVDNQFIFNYVNPELNDAKKVGFNYYPGFENTNKEYKSDKLFTNIITRLPNQTRPDYLEILNSYNLDENSSEFDILRNTRGRVITDNYEFVPAFDINKIEFEIAGCKHCDDLIKCKSKLKINDKLYLEHENDNKQDINAIKIIYENNEKKYHIGYVPRYYSKELLDELNKGIQYSAMIKNLNFESKLDDDVTVDVKLIFKN